MSDSENDPDITGEEATQILPKVNYGLSLDEAIDNHLVELEKFLKACLNANLLLSPRKAKFLLRRVEKLGFILSPYGISVPVKKRSAILHLKPPTSKTGARSLLGLANMISSFIPN